MVFSKMCIRDSNSTEAHKVMWDTDIEEAVKEAQETMGVEFVYDVDKEAFREATQPMIEACLLYTSMFAGCSGCVFIFI